MWKKGQPFRVVDCLDCLDDQIRAFAPRAVPPATDPKSWGSLADDEHSSDSDHYPHFYAALGAKAVVCARDFPHAPALGLDGHAVTEALRLSRDPRIGYVIFAGRIFSGHVVDGVAAFTWRPYTGKDNHGTHFHVSSVHDGRADSTVPWKLPGAAPTPNLNPTPPEADMIYTVTGVPAGAKDCTGAGVVENSRVVATPAGPWGLNGTEAGGLPKTYWDTIPKVSWARMLDLCARLKQDPAAVTVTVTDAQIVAAVKQALTEGTG